MALTLKEIFEVEATSQLTQADVNTMQQLLNAGRTAEVYIYYNQRIIGGSTQAILQAQINTYGGAVGGSALSINLEAKTDHPDLYIGSLDSKSIEIIQDFIFGVKDELKFNLDGILTDAQMMTRAEKIWDSWGLADEFLGGLYADLQTMSNFFSGDATFGDLISAGSNFTGDLFNGFGAYLTGAYLGKTPSQFLDPIYEHITRGDITYVVNKSTQITELVWDASVDFPLFPETSWLQINDEPLGLLGSIYQESVWEFLGANGRAYDPFALEPQINSLVPYVADWYEGQFNTIMDGFQGLKDFTEGVINSLLDVKTNTTLEPNESGLLDMDALGDSIANNYLIFNPTYSAQTTSAIVNGNGTQNTAIGNAIANGIRPGNGNLVNNAWEVQTEGAYASYYSFYTETPQFFNSNVTHAQLNNAQTQSYNTFYIDPVVMDLDGDGVELVDFSAANAARKGDGFIFDEGMTRISQVQEPI